ncbi:DsrE family protein [Methanofollis fontis]|nr:DsrE family protein [Methanofollis fontis]
MTTYRALFHLNDNRSAPGVFANIRNLLDDLDDDVAIEVVGNGEGVKTFLITGKHADEVKALSGKNVSFAACSNSLRSHGFTKDDLPRCVTIVPSGVGEIVRRQAEGYAYLKP